MKALQNEPDDRPTATVFRDELFKVRPSITKTGSSGMVLLNNQASTSPSRSNESTNNNNNFNNIGNNNINNMDGVIIMNDGVNSDSVNNDNDSGKIYEFSPSSFASSGSY